MIPAFVVNYSEDTLRQTCLCLICVRVIVEVERELESLCESLCRLHAETCLFIVSSSVHLRMCLFSFFIISVLKCVCVCVCVCVRAWLTVCVCVCMYVRVTDVYRGGQLACTTCLRGIAAQRPPSPPRS